MGWFTREYGGKGYKTPTTQDTKKSFGRGKPAPSKGCYPAGKPRWA
ncbi:MULTISPECIES: hypothetical protein [Pseudonocardia]|uniref:Uncharacterized protein n=2 Tax=Pseudonocardia TaxID=1847 RepID=A0A1Y2N635_PSEAH|nr:MULTISPECIES: hypothetical protein [Pseudonocardia]OSY42930.1 hypothetical protein BG845_01172 [Pseudonocardia autotrophica]TDN77506.1 hypothetical protein C8E95_6754 [Pseudonocardia autotrophica]BBG01531.1 hypothetical protein Pdca_27400 [Pseudonocardia autotrophica]GEC25315.1 hypothetical protein PSA01_23440 [Pseudonocardia saturnea]